MPTVTKSTDQQGPPALPIPAQAQGNNNAASAPEPGGDGDDSSSLSSNEEPAEETPIDPIQKYGNPFKKEVTFDLLPLYKPFNLAARRMYKRPQIPPIVLHCMGYGVPSFPDDLNEDPDIQKTFTRGKGGLFTKSDVLPTTRSVGKPYLQKELVRRAVVTGKTGGDLPKPSNYSIPTMIRLLRANPPPVSEHQFILAQLQELRESIISHYSGHSGTAGAALNRDMRKIEVLFHPSHAKDWKERNWQKNRQVLCAEASNSEQCETNDDLISVYVKAANLYNSDQALKSRAFVEYGKPLDVSRKLHPVGEEFYIEPEVLKNWYTKSRGVINMIRGKLYQSGQGNGSYTGDTVKSFADSHIDAYVYLTLQKCGQVDEYCQSFDRNKGGTMTNVPKTSTKSNERSATKAKHSTPNSDSIDAINGIAAQIERFGNNTSVDYQLYAILMINYEQMKHRYWKVKRG